MPATPRSLLSLALVAFALPAACALLDARPSLAVCNQPGLFQPPTFRDVGLRVNRVVLADLNRDGILDLITTNPEDLPASSYTSQISVMIGNGSGGVGDGTFSAPVAVTVGTRPETVVAADFDGDGLLDLAVANWGSNTVSILHGLGNGSFGARTDFPCGPGPYTVVAADFNHDGILDLAVANNSVASVSVLIGQGSGRIGNGSFGPPTSYPVPNLSLGLVVGDLDRDGNLDLVATARFQGVAVLKGVGNGTFQAAHTYPAGAEAYNLTLADVDGDGILDLLVANSGFGGVAVLKGDGNAGFGAPTFYGNGTINAGAVVYQDFDGDGIGDFAVSNAGNGVVPGVISVFKGQGSGGVGNGTFVAHSDYTIQPYPLGLASADLNHDGFMDLVVASYTPGGATILMGGCTTPPPPPPPPGTPHLVSVRDVPNDQGGKVFLRWTASSFDTHTDDSVIGYRVWRRLPPSSAARAQAAGMAASSPTTAFRAIPRPGGPSGVMVDYWEAIADLPAEQLQGYGYTAATTQDSLPGSNPLTAFFVTALTGYVGTFYESNVDSGYSVDNLSPPTPMPFTAVYTGISNTLHWGASRAPDLLEFRLYRGASPDFTPGPGNLVTATRDTGFVDAPGSVYYKLAALDIHSNLSRYALVSPELPVATLAAVTNVTALADRIQITWFDGGNAGIPATVYRRSLGTDWVQVAQIAADGTGYLHYEDLAVQAGERFGYRLGIWDGGAEQFVAEVWATARPPAFALEGVRPNPSPPGQLVVDFVLPSEAPATLELFDLAGRKVAAREVGALGAGRHSVNLGEGARIPAGVYVVRFRSGGESRSARAVVLH